MNAEEIVNALRDLRVSQSAIAALIGRDRSAVSRLMSGRRPLKLAEAEKLEELIKGITNDSDRLNAEENARALRGPITTEVAALNTLGATDPKVMLRDVPIYGGGYRSKAIIFDDVDFDLIVDQTVHFFSWPVGSARRPVNFESSSSFYGVYLSTLSMSPRYEPGDLVFLDPDRFAAPGEDVLVHLLEKPTILEDLTDGNYVTTMCRRLVRYHPDGVELAAFSPARTFLLPRRHYSAMHRVVNLHELMSR